ncbi:MAG: hypothetical protein FWE23_03405 [Chitinivibrionia bacterium]|jgi:hypothetical protein|nr:hypothetical protein [Chitinivibrionia bacterium]
MQKYLIIAMALSFVATSFAELYSPDAWSSFRRDTLEFSVGVNDADSGKIVNYELQHRDENGRMTVLSTQSRRANEAEWTLMFSGIRRETVGQSALWVQEKIGGNTRVYGPYGLIRTPLLETADTISLFNDDVNNFPLGADDIYRFAYNRNGLFVGINTSRGDLTVSLDPANSKTAFLAFANRIVRYNAEQQTLEFLFPERSIEQRTMAIQYRVRDWEGDMRVHSIANGKLVFIPWHDLGMLFEAGRRFGFMVHGTGFAYPAKASRHAPATWGNLILQ